MEVELKYAVPDEETAQRIWNDDELGNLIEEDSCRVDRYYGSYYDTPGHILTDNDIAFRIRHEGERTVACLKWHGSRHGALHKREELNVTIEGDIPEKADPEIFRESEKGKEIIEMTGGEKIPGLFDVDVLRKSMRVDTGSSIIELSIDRGKIRTAAGDVPISEVELELFQGDEQSLMETGEWLAGKYDLEAEKRSKFARGLAKLKGE